MTDEAPEPRTISPFKIINRNEDTVDEDGNIIFADFRPNVTPAERVEKVEVVALPKDLSVPAPADSSTSPETSEQTTSEIPVQEPADKEDGALNPNETSKPPSSSPPKRG